MSLTSVALRVAPIALVGMALGFTPCGYGTSPAQAQTGAGLGGISHQQSASVRATVLAVDQANRTVELRGENGQTMSLKVPQDVAAFSQVKPGDTVRAAYYLSLTFVQSQPGVAAPQPRAVGEAQRMRGAKPTAVTASQHVTNVLVVGVNPAANTIQLVDPVGGEVKTFEITDPTLQQALPRVRPGATITIIAVAAVAVSLQPG